MSAAKPSEVRCCGLGLVVRGESVARVARGLGISEVCLRRRMDQDAVDNGRAVRVTSVEMRKLVEHAWS